MRLAPVVLAAVALATSACLRDPLDDRPDGPTVDGRIYAEGVCSLRCWRLEQCNALDEPLDKCTTACRDEALESIFVDPCWVETLEVRRCVAQRLSCEQVIDDAIPDSHDSPCEQWLDHLDTCEL